MLPSVDPVAKEAGKDHQEGASHLELPGPLDGDARDYPQTLFRCAKANQALDQKAPPQRCQQDGYPRPNVMKTNDDRAKWQIQKPVHERASFPLTP